MAGLLLSIIIPVSNVEDYIRPCLESIFRQGLDEDCFEVILVDDGSTDRSMSVVADMIASHRHVLVIRQDHAGPSVSRNTGLDKAQGDYVLFVDSDDILMDNGLPILLQKAIDTSADMVVADYVRIKDEDMLASYEAHVTDQSAVGKSGLDYYLEDYRPEEGSFIWRSLYRRTFLEENQIRFRPGVYYEDIPFIQKCYLRARLIIGLHLLYYIYRIRPRSCTYSFTMKNALDYNTAIADSWDLMKSESLPAKVELQMRDNIYVFFNYAIDCVISVFTHPAEREAIVDDLTQKVPDLYFCHGFAQRLVSSAFRSMPNRFVGWRLFTTKVRNWFKAHI